MPGKAKTPFGPWLKVVERIYPMKGLPRSEFRRYYDAGMSPLLAMEAAVQRRRKNRRIDRREVKP
jgi:hypothetical protein